MSHQQLQARQHRQVRYKTLAVDELGIKNIEDSNTISGYASIFNYKDTDGDILLHGAFTRSIGLRGPNSQAKGKIVMLRQHNMKEPIGKVTVLHEDEKGLYFEAQLDDVTAAKEVKAQLKSGTINQFSIGFTYIPDRIKYSEKDNAYLISDVDLYEISAVTFGANDQTEFLGFKGTDINEEIEDVLSSLSYEDAYNVRQLISKCLNLNSTATMKAAIVDNTVAINEAKEILKNLKLI